LFFIIFLYALRKVIPWLGRFGTARHWMDFHVIAGVTAPIIIAFHASFKFRGIAGVAFWIMLAVALSGIIGRYLYAQIPRSLNAAELSLSELRIERRGTCRRPARTVLLFRRSVDAARFMCPLPNTLSKSALCGGRRNDRSRYRPSVPCSRLRRSSSNFGTKLKSLGGLLSSGNTEVEVVVRLVRQKSSFSKRVVFLGQTQKVFHLWHVIHRPFSYAFAVLAVVHIVVVLGLGFASMGFR
jgi:hypothetical protein